jgi:hypothetical protein
MTVNLSALAGAGQQFFDNNGVPLSGGKLYSYEAGTTTPQTTYTTATGAPGTEHTNPIILDSAGRVPGGQIWLSAGLDYKFVLKTSLEVPIASWDNITGINGTGIAVDAANVSYVPAGNFTETNAQDALDELTTFSGASIIGYLPAGVGAVSTTVQTKLRESVSVKDFGAVGNGSTDDTVAIQTAINSSPFKTVFFPSGNYKVSSAININSTVNIQGAGAAQTTVSQVTLNSDTFVFAPTTAGVTSDFLNFPSIQDISVNYTNTISTSVSGAGVRFVQCNGYKLFNVTVFSAPEGITVQGGQFGSLKSFQIYVSSGLLNDPDTALLYFRQAPVGAGFQPCFTVEIEDFRLSASKLRETCIYIRNADGLQFSNAYIAFGGYSLLKVKAERDNSYVSAVSFTNIYFDCVGAGRTPYGIDIPEDGFANSWIYQLQIGSGCIVGNGDEVGILARKLNMGLFSIQNVAILNFGKWAIDVEGTVTNTDLQISDCQISNTGDVTSGSIRASTGRSLSVVGNSFIGTENLVLSLSGTWRQAAVTGNINGSGVQDLVNSATVTYGLELAGNASRYTFTANSWKSFFPTAIYGTVTHDFGALNDNESANYDFSVSGAQVGDVCYVNLNGGTAIYSTGTGNVNFSAGVISADTVRIRAVNQGATIDPPSLIFNYVVNRSAT